MDRTGVAAVLIAALLAAGCAGRQPGAPGGAGGPGVADDQLRGRTFLSTSVRDGAGQRQLVAGTRVSLRFTDDGRLLADAGCNTMAGSVDTRGGRLTVPDLAVTDMGCDPPRHEQDSWLAGFLGAKPSWRLDGSDLELSAGGTELVLADREVAEPDLPLEGTRWVVDTVVSGDVAASTPAGGTATVTFGTGELAVDTGCNTGTGGYQVTGATIAVTAPAVTRKACAPDLMQLEQAVLAVLDGQVTFTVDADRLSLTHPSGKGLQLRGER